MVHRANDRAAVGRMGAENLMGIVVSSAKKRPDAIGERSRAFGTDTRPGFAGEDGRASRGFVATRTAAVNPTRGVGVNPARGAGGSRRHRRRGYRRRRLRVPQRVAVRFGFV